MAVNRVGENPHWILINLLRPFAGRLILGLVFMGLAVAVQLAYPKALSYFIDHISSQRNAEWYGVLAIIMLAVIILQAVATSLRYYLFESTGYMVVTKVRRQLFGALMEQSVGYYDAHNVGELSNRLASDVEVLHETLTMGLAIALRCLLIFFGGVIMLLLISPSLSLILLFFLPISLVIGSYAGKKFQRKAREIQASQAASGKVAHEHFSNIRLVHAFNQQRTARLHYFNASENALGISVASTRLFAFFRGVSSFLVYLALLIALWVGAKLIDRGELTLGELTGFILYASMVTDAASAISDIWGEWMRAIGATEKIFEIIASVASSDEKNCTDIFVDPVEGKPLSGSVVFDSVTFAYPERAEKFALFDIDLRVSAGETVALVGSSGAGKSTIANLILGFYLPTKGRVSFDGMVIANENIGRIRKQIAIVEQEPALFSGTIFENIAFAVFEREVTIGEVRTVAKLAFAHEFIEGFPDAYNTIVGDRGVQLSGGQKQRIAIARALLRNPTILILDEATSALDSASESQVQAALDRLMLGRTTIIIAHRYSTIVKSDRIIVMEHGKVIQQGTHSELLGSKNGRYARLMESQLDQYQSLASQT